MMESSGVSASRQKNCNNCVQTKRRCDRRMPICSLCAKKNIHCTYSKTKVASQPDRHDFGVLFGNPAGSFFASDLSLDVSSVGDLPTGSPPNPAIQSMPESILHASGSGDIPMGNFMDWLGNHGTPHLDQWLVPTDESLFTERPSTPVDEEIVRGYEKMASFCSHIEPWHLYDPNTPLHYVTSRLKSFTTDMAMNNATPFLHRYLYQDYTPKCIMSCFSTSVLYANRTSANTAMMMRTLHGNVRELVDTEARRIVSTPTEKLARAQALFLYQIIRLFDGDVALRAQGEKDLPLLQAWLGELCKLRENLGDLAQLEHSAARKQPPVEWKRWIFAESLRRTVVMAYSVITLYEVMKDPERKGDPGPWAYVHRWTLARSLWEAQSSFDFYHRWKENPHFIIANYSFEHFLDHGRGDDVDEFAEILLTMYMGVNATKDFISARGTPNKVTN